MKVVSVHCKETAGHRRGAANKIVIVRLIGNWLTDLAKIFTKKRQNIYIKILYKNIVSLKTAKYLTLEEWEKYLSKKPEILIYVTLRAWRANISVSYADWIQFTESVLQNLLHDVKTLQGHYPTWNGVPNWIRPENKILIHESWILIL